MQTQVRSNRYENTPKNQQNIPNPVDHPVNRYLRPGLGDPGILGRAAVCQSVRDLEELLYALYCFLDPGLYRRLLRSICGMAVEGVSGGRQKRRPHQPDQDGHLLVHPGPDPVRGGAAGDRIGQELLIACCRNRLFIVPQ